MYSLPIVKFQQVDVHRLYAHCVFQLCIIVYPENSISGLVVKSFLTLVTPRTVAHQAPLLLELSRQEC